MRTPLPSGIITCLFSDIEGSTQLLRELGVGFEAVLERHRELLREAWKEHDGHEVKTIGDGFFVVFAEARNAVAAALGAQRALALDHWPGHVRIGMHTGFARPSGNDYTALVVNQAARVCGAARGGQILASAETAAACGTHDGNGAVSDLRSLGRFRVRDFDGPVELFIATDADVPLIDEHPRVPPADGHNLVRPTTSIIGRGDDLKRLGDRIAPGRVTTLVGPGGVGKTRLATEAALAAFADWEDGAWFVDLAPLGDGALIAEAIGAAVAAPATPGADRWQEVLGFLRDRSTLVVLDNCEHLSDESARAAGELISACPRTGVLATSRRPLGLRGEQVYRLSPLVTEGAVDLFLDRATEKADRDLVAELCAELDGLPLAIELAAARTTAIPAGEILRQVRRSHGFVSSRDPSLPDRQRSLERLLDWSLDLLPVAARTVLGRLSVFASSFDLDAAEAVAAGENEPEAKVPEIIWDLIDASLVRPAETAGATRYRLLATVRAHAGARVDAAALADAQRRLARLMTERVGPARATQRAWVFDMELELDNVRGAAAHVDDDAVALALAWSIGRYHDLRDSYRDGILELRRFLEARPGRRPEHVALLALLADLHLRLGELAQADAVLAGAEELVAEVGIPDWAETDVARARGEIALRSDDAAGAIAVVRERLDRVHSPYGRARLFDLLGVTYAATGELEAAADAFSAELSETTAAGIETSHANVHGNLAETYLRLGDERGAAHHQAIALALARDWGQPVQIAFGMMIGARLAAAQGRAADAVALQAKADDLLDRANYVLFEEDERIRAELLERAAASLGSAAYEEAAGRGSALADEAAADLAERLLSEVGSVVTPEGRN